MSSNAESIQHWSTIVLTANSGDSSWFNRAVAQRTNLLVGDHHFLHSWFFENLYKFLELNYTEGLFKFDKTGKDVTVFAFAFWIMVCIIKRVPRPFLNPNIFFLIFSFNQQLGYRFVGFKKNHKTHNLTCKRLIFGFLPNLLIIIPWKTHNRLREDHYTVIIKNLVSQSQISSFTLR